MKKVIFSLMLFVVLALLGCNTAKRVNKPFISLYRDTYYADSVQDPKILNSTQRFELIFFDDTYCSFVFTFLCKDVDKEYRVIEQKCRYERREDTIFVFNLNPKNLDDVLIDIPEQKSKKCFFLEKEARSCIGCRRLLYYIYFRVPNVTNDTLIIKPNGKIIFEKNIQQKQIIA